VGGGNRDLDGNKDLQVNTIDNDSPLVERYLAKANRTQDEVNDVHRYGFTLKPENQELQTE